MLHLRTERDARNTGREWHSHHPPLALALGRDLRSRRPVSARSLGRVVVGLDDSAYASSRPARRPERAHPCPLARPRSPRAQLRGWMVLQPPRRCHPPPRRARARRASRPRLRFTTLPDVLQVRCPSGTGEGERRRRGTTFEIRVVHGIGSDSTQCRALQAPLPPTRASSRQRLLHISLLRPWRGLGSDAHSSLRYTTRSRHHLRAPARPCSVSRPR